MIQLILFYSPGVAAAEKGFRNGNYGGTKEFTFKVFTIDNLKHSYKLHVPPNYSQVLWLVLNPEKQICEDIGLYSSISS